MRVLQWNRNWRFSSDTHQIPRLNTDPRILREYIYKYVIMQLKNLDLTLNENPSASHETDSRWQSCNTRLIVNRLCLFKLMKINVHSLRLVHIDVIIGGAYSLVSSADLEGCVASFVSEFLFSLWIAVHPAQEKCIVARRSWHVECGNERKTFLSRIYEPISLAINPESCVLLDKIDH